MGLSSISFFHLSYSYDYYLDCVRLPQALIPPSKGGTYTWESADGHSTRMTLHNKSNTTGFSMLFSPFMSLMMKRANNKDLNKIKFLLEKR
jgi:hypothetical protein